MSEATASAGELARHLERAAEWRLLAQVFAYPDASWARRLEPLQECLCGTEVIALAQQAAREASPELWMRLFGPAGPVRIRSISFEGGLQPGYLLAELAAFYEAFGYAAPAVCAPDELSALLDFAAWLEMKLAYASVQADREAFEVTIRALESFLSRFVSPAAWRVFRQLEGLGPDFLVEAARLAGERAGPEPTWPAQDPNFWPDGSSLADLSCGGADFAPMKQVR